MRCRVAWLLLLCAGTLFARQSQLKIVVVEGEGAVNIIQQKTAVTAIVEVRDQNNLPVPGATVTFAIAGNGGGAVAGAETVTISTNAAGQAALSGVTPLSSGGLQISVNATFNGLTASTSITQSVVTTAAAAGAGAGTAGAGAAGAGAAGAGAAAAGAAAGAAVGGGLSTAAVAGIIGGVAAVGGGVAAAGGGGSDGGSGSGGGNSTGTAGPPPVSSTDPNATSPPSTPAPSPNPNGPPCRFLVSPTDVLVAIEGGVISIAIVMEPEGCANQNWVVDVGNAGSWISTDQRSGVRHGGVLLTIAPFTPTPGTVNRVATVNVAGTGVLISQPCRCPAFAIRPE